MSYLSAEKAVQSTDKCENDLVPCSEFTTGLNRICATPEEKLAGSCPITKIDVVPKIVDMGTLDDNLQQSEVARLLDGDREPIEDTLSFEIRFSKSFNAAPIVEMVYE